MRKTWVNRNICYAGQPGCFFEHGLILKLHLECQQRNWHAACVINHAFHLSRYLDNCALYFITISDNNANSFRYMDLIFSFFFLLSFHSTPFCSCSDIISGSTFVFGQKNLSEHCVDPEKGSDVAILYSVIILFLYSKISLFSF